MDAHCSLEVYETQKRKHIKQWQALDWRKERWVNGWEHIINMCPEREEREVYGAFHDAKV